LLVDEPVFGVDEPVSGVDEPVSGVDEPVSGVDEPISGAGSGWIGWVASGVTSGAGTSTTRPSITARAPPPTGGSSAGQ